MVTILWRLQTTQPTSGVAVTADTNCYAHCVEPSAPSNGVPIYHFWATGHVDPLDGWRCSTTPPNPGPSPLPTPHITTTQRQTHVQHSPCSHRIVKAQTQLSHPLAPLSTHATTSQTHTHLTCSTNSSSTARQLR